MVDGDLNEQDKPVDLKMDDAVSTASDEVSASWDQLSPDLFKASTSISTEFPNLQLERISDADKTGGKISKTQEKPADAGKGLEGLQAKLTDDGKIDIEKTNPKSLNDAIDKGIAEGKVKQSGLVSEIEIEMGGKKTIVHQVPHGRDLMYYDKDGNFIARYGPKPDGGKVFQTVRPDGTTRGALEFNDTGKKETRSIAFDRDGRASSIYNLEQKRFENLPAKENRPVITYGQSGSEKEKVDYGKNEVKTYLGKKK
jgi:hypothetical protein